MTLTPPKNHYAILIVDDNENNRFTLRTLLQRLPGCTLFEADSGEQALATTVLETIHLILLDVQMPVMDGFETARHLAMTERTRHIPLVFLTAIYKGDAFVQQGYELGAVDYLTKPIDDNLLINRIRFYRTLHEREEHLVDTMQSLRREIDQRKAMEVELMKARELAEAANRAKSVFLSHMSHELRTPLTAILGFSEMLQLHQGLPDDVLRGLGIINRSGEHLLQLINEVLDLSKIEAGHLQLEPKSFHLNPLITDLMALMQERAYAKGLKLTLETDAALPDYIHSDPARMRQILLNLIGNAIKCTERGGVIVRLQTEQQHDHDSVLRIEIEDSGSGIAEADIKRIFEPFVQVGSTVQQGTGLGLAITRKFISMMQGTIEVESHPGQGSLFRVRLPVTLPDHEEADMMAYDAATPPLIDQRDTASMPLLVVDDQAESRRLLGSILRRWGFTVHEAGNGEEAVAQFEQHKPVMIWMDVRMPVMNGLQAAQKIRQLPGGESVVIIAFTASLFEEKREEIFAAGMDEVVGKPFHAQEISRCLENFLKRSR